MNNLFKLTVVALAMATTFSASAQLSAGANLGFYKGNGLSTLGLGGLVDYDQSEKITVGGKLNYYF